MDIKEALYTIDCHYPPANYSQLRQALDIAIAAIKHMDHIHTIGIKAAENQPKRDELDDANSFYDILNEVREWEDEVDYRQNK